MLEIAVCDDDIADLECAVNMLHKIFTSQKIAYHIEKFMSANQMLENISRIDIGILDISMEELNGIKLGRKLKEKFPDVKLVYITSYEEYCMQVINEVHAFSFLCKPLEYDKLETQMLELLDQLPDTGAERILSLAILPAPLCSMPLWFGVADPVRMNCPFSPL